MNRISPFGLSALLIVFGDLIHGPVLACTLSFNSGQVITGVALAHTPEQHSLGLSGRPIIDQAMLFVWSEAQVRRFWMKDTHQPLVLYYLDEQARIFQQLSMMPHSEYHHFSQSPARYALELPQVMANQVNLSVGSVLSSVECLHEPHE